jgi:hypothetical protein
MGGYATWDLALMYPERFAAIVPSCLSRPERCRAHHLASDLGLFTAEKMKRACRTFAGMVAALQEVGNPVQFTLIPMRATISWTQSYDNPQLYQWLLQQRRGQPMQPLASTTVIYEKRRNPLWLSAAFLVSYVAHEYSCATQRLAIRIIYDSVPSRRGLAHVFISANNRNITETLAVCVLRCRQDAFLRAMFLRFRFVVLEGHRAVERAGRHRRCRSDRA